MEELIKIEEKDGQRVVSARELYSFLQVGRDFTTWIKGRIDKYDFEENIDFTVIWNDTKTGDVVAYNGNSNSMVKMGYQSNYAITIDMAKELCMVENNELGKKARKYFIACEKQLKNSQPILSLQEQLALKVFNGGLDAIEAHKQLIELETKRLTKEIIEPLKLDLKDTKQDLEHAEDTIMAFATNVSLMEKRQRISQIVKYKTKNYKERYNLLYSEFNKKFHIDVKRRLDNAKERGDIKKSVNIMEYICSEKYLNKTNELYDVAVKLFEGNFIKLLDEWRDSVEN